ncbi:serine/threonine-protein kinase [Arenimonas sp.]|uniref:serine/threonine-protein kinase n=1 Tax=Arenimonas sp. TaxID=1872635 RepID=UPI0039E6FC16
MKARVGHYEIVAELGRGGMGVVYKGYEPALARYVAIKELAPALAHDTMLVERFLREARSMAALNDPHIIQIYFIGQEDEQPFFVMEFVDGESLSQVIKREQRLPVGDALKILHQATKGLSVAHDQGVIHRDIKPANLMLTQRGQVKIADFGIALANRDFDSKLTGTGQLVGTPGYLSPEVCLGKPVDQRSDIFALGIVLFEMLTGRTPFSDESPLKLMLDVVQSQIPDVRELNQSVDADVAALLTKMLAKDPADRYQDAHELIRDLEKLPQVVQGGPLSMKVAAPSGPAATLVAMATPVTPMSSRVPTPPPRVGSLPSTSAAPVVPAVAVETAMGSTRPGVTQPSSEPAPRPSRTVWPAWAALALLLVAGGAFGVYKMVTPKPAEPVAVTTPTETDKAASLMGDASADASAALAADAAANKAPDGSSDAAPAVAEPPAPPPVSEPAPAEQAVAQVDEPAADTGTKSRRERIAEARKERVEEVRAANTFAVQTDGDPALMIPAEQLIEDKLSNAGFSVVNPSRADIVLRVKAEIIGSQNLQFYGQSATVTTAYLIVRPYRNGRPIGSGIRQKLDYTPLNAEDKVEMALRTPMERLADSIRQ